MRTIGGFDAKPGTIIHLKVTQVEDGVVTFRGVLKRFVSSGGGIDATWPPAVLMGPGGTAVLAAIHGYNVIIIPVAAPNTNPSMTVELSGIGPSTFSDTTTQQVGDNIPFGWRIFMV